LSTISRLGWPRELEKCALSRKGAPVASASWIKNRGIPLTAMGIWQFVSVSPAKTTLGWVLPTSRSSLAYPAFLQKGSRIASFTVSFDRKLRVTLAWQPGHRRAMLRGSCALASTKAGSTCSYSTMLPAHTTQPNPHA
jgi:hypothetical protein